jgi:hypothetical protein
MKQSLAKRMFGSDKCFYIFSFFAFVIFWVSSICLFVILKLNPEIVMVAHSQAWLSNLHQMRHCHCPFTLASSHPLKSRVIFAPLFLFTVRESFTWLGWKGYEH